MKKNILIIAPHPDDEVLGCGGTIAKLAPKNNIFLCIATKAYYPQWTKEFIRKRPAEVKKSSQILGIKKVFFLGLPSLKLNILPQNKISESILKIILKIKPEIIFVPHRGDINKDHQIIHDSCLVSCRPTNINIKLILAYEVLSSTEWGNPIEFFKPNVYSDITNFLNKKIAAMKIYSSELKNPPHPRSLEIIKVLAQKRGSEIGCKFAESFMLIRQKI